MTGTKHKILSRSILTENKNRRNKRVNAMQSVNINMTLACVHTFTHKILIIKLGTKKKSLGTFRHVLILLNRVIN